MNNNLKRFLAFPIAVVAVGVGVMLYAWYSNVNGPWNWSTIQLLLIIGGVISFVGVLVLFYFLLKKETTNQASVNSASATIDHAEELKKYKDLLDSGVITQEEFDAKKKQILGL